MGWLWDIGIVASHGNRKPKYASEDFSQVTSQYFPELVSFMVSSRI